MKDYKTTIKDIISKFTQHSSSVFSQKVFSEAGEFGIGEGIVNENIKLLKDEKFIHEPIPGLLKRQ
ncbi:MAG: hypothetical protein V1914_03935 [archaeon]